MERFQEVFWSQSKPQGAIKAHVQPANSVEAARYKVERNPLSMRLRPGKFTLTVV